MQVADNKLFNLEGKIVVITGALGLLGKNHVQAVAQHGGVPILVDLDEDLLREYAEHIKQTYGVECEGIKLNITKENEVSKSADYVFDKYGKIDALVNNAANNPKVETVDGKNFSRLENFPLSAWEQDLSVGLTGSFLCAKHFGFAISKNKQGGVIVNISSDLGVMAPDQRLYFRSGVENNTQPVKPVTYSVTKAGIIGLTRYLSTYWTSENVRCNAICPGGVENGQPEEFLRKVHQRIPLNRLAREDEYRSTLVWMLSDHSSYLNGAIVSVDGGRTAW